MKIYTVFVEAKTPGNIGFLARTMKNFGLKKLVLIKPCKLENSAYYQAVHARELVQDAQKYDSIEEFIEDNEITTVIGTTGTAGGSYNIPRIPITPDELAKNINTGGNVALIFGREGEGLSNEELELCDVLVTIPTSEEYPIMNISHAAAIIFYEIFKHKKDYPIDNMDIADYDDKQVITCLCDEIISQLEYPDHKRRNVEIITKRIIGRAFIAGREAKTLRGTLNRINNRIKDTEE